MHTCVIVDSVLDVPRQQQPGCMPSGIACNDVEMKSPERSFLSSPTPSSPFVPRSADKNDLSALFFHPSSPDNYSSPLASRQFVDGVPSRKRRSADPEEDEDETQHGNVGVSSGILSLSSPSPFYKRPKPMTLGRTMSLVIHAISSNTKSQQQPDAPQPLPKRVAPRRLPLSSLAPITTRAASATSFFPSAIEKPLISAPPTPRAFSQVLTIRTYPSSSPFNTFKQHLFDLTVHT